MSDVWWVDYLQQPLALAIPRWAEGTLLAWTGMLRDLGRFVVHWPNTGPDQALSQYLVQRAAMGLQPSTLCRVILAVRMAEKLRCIPPTVRLEHWLMARRAAVISAAPRRTQVWAELATVQAMVQAVCTSSD